jgi:uncharacterized membrane protein YtjA (UPF0391 family)
VAAHARHRYRSGGYKTSITASTSLLVDKGGDSMLHYAVVFLIIALIAAVFGFGGIAAGAAGIAKVLFVIFLIGAVVSFLMHGRSRI